MKKDVGGDIILNKHSLEEKNNCDLTIYTNNINNTDKNMENCYDTSCATKTYDNINSRKFGIDTYVKESAKITNRLWNNNIDRYSYKNGRNGVYYNEYGKMEGGTYDYHPVI